MGVNAIGMGLLDIYAIFRGMISFGAPGVHSESNIGMGGATQMTYDPMGNMLTLTDARSGSHSARTIR